jgi:hypothetical protein
MVVYFSIGGNKSMHSTQIQEAVVRWFWKVFVVFVALCSISIVFPFPFNQITLYCGFTSLGFGFGLIGTLSIMQEYENRSKPLP